MLTTANIIEKKAYFEELTYHYISNSLKSFEKKEYLTSGVWAAVYAEALLKDILTILEIETSKEDFYILIKTLRNNVTDCSQLSGKDKVYLLELAKRCDEIRNKRNRLVHDIRIEQQGLDSDVRDINNNLFQMTGYYLGTSVAEAVYQKNCLSNQKEKLKPDFPMFISTISPHSFEQREFLNEFCDKLQEIGVIPVRCEFDDFDKKDPIGKVCSIIRECKGMIVIGLERSHVYYYKDREGSEKESEAIHRRYTSGWLHLESGIGAAYGKPIFVICQDNIFSDGIFDRDWNTYIPIELSLPLSIDDPQVSILLKKISTFRKKTMETEF